MVHSGGRGGSLSSSTTTTITTAAAASLGSVLFVFAAWVTCEGWVWGPLLNHMSTTLRCGVALRYILSLVMAQSSRHSHASVHLFIASLCPLVFLFYFVLHPRAQQQPSPRLPF